MAKQDDKAKTDDALNTIEKAGHGSVLSNPPPAPGDEKDPLDASGQAARRVGTADEKPGDKARAERYEAEVKKNKEIHEAAEADRAAAHGAHADAQAQLALAEKAFKEAKDRAADTEAALGQFNARVGVSRAATNPVLVGDIPVVALKDNHTVRLGDRSYSLKKGEEVMMSESHANELSEGGWVSPINVFKGSRKASGA